MLYINICTIHIHMHSYKNICTIHISLSSVVQASIPPFSSDCIHMYVVEVNKIEQNGGLAARTAIPAPTSGRHFMRHNLLQHQPFLWKLGLGTRLYRLYETS